MDENNFDPGMFAIDRNHLDIEWEKQSSNCFEACRLAAGARLYVEDTKRALDVERANADIAIRRDPAKFGFTAKPTESAIDAVITVMPSIQDLMDKVSKAQYQWNICNAAVTALENKKKGLESLTQLRSMNYFSVK